MKFSTTPWKEYGSVASVKNDENDNRLPTLDDCILWLDNKYARHNELEDKYAADYLRALRLQLSRAKEWMQHEPRCNIHDHHFGGMPSCTCGLAEFLKEVEEIK